MLSRSRKRIQRSEPFREISFEPTALALDAALLEQQLERFHLHLGEVRVLVDILRLGARRLLHLVAGEPQQVVRRPRHACHTETQPPWMRSNQMRSTSTYVLKLLVRVTTTMSHQTEIIM